MKTLAREKGRVLLFINVDELIPAGGIYMPEVVPLMTQRYSFSSPPNLSTPWSQVLEDGLKFEMGKFRGPNNEEIVIQDFTFYNNGLVVTTESTEISDAILHDFFDWGAEAIRLRLTESLFRFRAYLSEVVVEFETPVDRSFRRVAELMNAFSHALKQRYENDFPPISISSLRLDYDRAVAPLTFQSLAAFVVERRINHRFTENVYLCVAPLPTMDHIRLLEQLEKLLNE